MRYKIYIDFLTDQENLAYLEKGVAGNSIIFPKKPAASVLHMAHWDQAMVEADIIFGQPDPKHISKAHNLKWLHISSSGFTRYDNPEFRTQMAQRNVAVTNSASVYSHACADQMLSFMLAQSRQLPLSLRTSTAGGSAKWTEIRNSSLPLNGQFVLIVGYGAIGKRLVELLAPFEMQITAYRRVARGDETVPVTTGDKLNSVLAQADHIVNILPESDETRLFFNANRFRACKPKSVFYNIGRGSTVDQDALLAVLRDGNIKAAWLDVTSPEPLPDDHSLRKEPNCFITPHVAGGHFNETKTLIGCFIKNLKRFQNNEPLFDRIM